VAPATLYEARAQSSGLAAGHRSAREPSLQSLIRQLRSPQVEAGSYDNIALSLGTDSPADILFATDNEHEAEAAIAAGWQVLALLNCGKPPVLLSHLHDPGECHD
jgi:hypothetical protein